MTFDFIVLTILWDFETLMNQAREFGYEGDRLREYVVKEQAVPCEERKAKRDKDIHDADKAAKKEAYEAELVA